MQKFQITEANAHKRLDVAITEELTELTRSFVNKLCDKGKVRVNDKVQQASYKLKNGDMVEVDVDLDQLKVTPNIELPILYEDDDVIVIDKPVDVLTHSKGAFNPEATVASFIKDKINFPATNEPNDRGGIVHRLDRATSGVIITARHPGALKWLQKQFSSRKAKKTYLAVIEGTLQPKEAIIDMPIARNPKHPKTFYVSPGGKPALTHYRVKETYQNEHSLIELKPETGRTHQLRVHLAYLGHPIIGDTLYKGADCRRMLLHAHKLEIVLPNKQKHEFVAEVPKDFHND